MNIMSSFCFMFVRYHQYFWPRQFFFPSRAMVRRWILFSGIATRRVRPNLEKTTRVVLIPIDRAGAAVLDRTKVAPRSSNEQRI